MHDVTTPTAYPVPQQPSMADLWNEFAGTPGQLADAVALRVAAVAPTSVHPGIADATPSAIAATVTPRRTSPLAEPVFWQLIKHGVQAALVASVLCFVLLGGTSPALALGYVGTALMLMGVVTVADRHRFIDHEPAFEIVDVIVPQQQQPTVRTAQVPAGPLESLVEQMQQALPDRLSVT